MKTDKKCNLLSKLSWFTLTFDTVVNIKTMSDTKNFGSLINSLRIQHKLSQKAVADRMGIDVSMLSKIEHGERQVQAHMIGVIAELFRLDAKKLHIDYLSSRIKDEYGNSPHFKESIKKCLTA